MTRVDLDELEAFYSSRAGGDAGVVAAVRELRAAREELRAWRMVGEFAKQHECSADYQRTVWAAINAIDERAGT